MSWVPLAVAALAACAHDVPPAEPDEYAREVLVETNRARAQHGLADLPESGCATREAHARARALTGEPLAHASLESVHEACKPHGGLTAENLSRSSAAPAVVVEAWMASPGHRDNVLSQGVTHIGVGCVVDDADGERAMLCSQLFLG